MSKKIVSLISISVLCLLVFSSIIMASSEVFSKADTQVILEKTEIKDLNILYDRAKKGVTDDSRFESKVILKNVEKGHEEPVATYSTTQLLKKVKLADGKEVDSFATTSFAILSKSQLNKIKDKNSFSIQGYTYDDKWDSTGGVKAYSTIYWTNYPSTRYPLTGAIETNQVTGGVYNYDTLHLGIRNPQAELVQNGLSDVTGWGISNQIVTIYPSSSIYTINNPGNWQKVQNYQSSTIGGKAQYEIYLNSRPSTSWMLYFNNLRHSGGL